MSESLCSVNKNFLEFSISSKIADARAILVKSLGPDMLTAGPLKSVGSNISGPTDAWAQFGGNAPKKP